AGPSGDGLHVERPAAGEAMEACHGVRVDGESTVIPDARGQVVCRVFGERKQVELLEAREERTLTTAQQGAEGRHARSSDDVADLPPPIERGPKGTQEILGVGECS